MLLFYGKFPSHATVHPKTKYQKSVNKHNLAEVLYQNAMGSEQGNETEILHGASSKTSNVSSPSSHEFDTIKGIPISSRERPDPTQAVVILLDSMLANPNDETLQLRAILSLLRMSSSKEERALVGDSGCIQTVIAAMRLFPRNGKIAFNGCGFLSNVAFGSSENKDRIRQCSGIDIVVDFMKERSSEEEFNEHACLALRNTTNLCHKSQLRATDIGAVEVLHSSLKRFDCNKKIQIHGIAALGNIANGGLDSQMRIREKGCIEAILFGMSQHTASRSVQEHGMVALRNVCFKNEKNQRRTGEKGGTDLLYNAMKNFNDCPELLTRACAAVRVLSFDETNRTAFGQNGTLLLMVNALTNTLKNSDAEGVVTVFKALSNVVFSPIENQKTFVSSGGIEAVTISTKKKGTNADVVEAGMRVFRNIADRGGELCDQLGTSMVFSSALQMMSQFKGHAGICEHVLALLLSATAVTYNVEWIGMGASEMKELVAEQVGSFKSSIPIQKIGQELLSSLDQTEQAGTSLAVAKATKVRKEVFEKLRHLTSS